MVESDETYWQRLQRSFAAVYAALEVSRIAWRVVLALLVIHTGLLAYSAYVHSPTLNEPGHLVAGLSHWKFGRFDVYNVNPPLVKMVAALPVIAVGYEEDWSGFYEGPGARPEMGMGENFVTANGERSFFLFMIARWACIPFSWLGAIICYLWARDLYGRPSGVMACAIWCFEPNILAHASLITSDAGATALGLAACYTFWRWLRRPTWAQAALTGVVLGLAELAKTTLILFYPLWPLMWLIYRWPDRHAILGRDWLREAGMLGMRMLIGLYVLNLGYGFEGSLTQLKSFHFVSGLFTGQPTGERHFGTSAPSNNCFADSWLGDVLVPLPKQYVLGIDIQQKDFEHFGRPSYLHGEWRDHGWWYYYLYACAIKIPLALWVIGAFALLARLRGTAGGDGPRLRDEFILLFPGAVIFVVASSKTGLNEHLRYVLPSFPFAFIWMSQSMSEFAPDFSNQGRHPPSDLLYSRYTPTCQGVAHPRALLATFLFGPLVCWFTFGSLWAYPHSLSYFNESIGGPLNGSRHLLGSNVDWGQDLRYILRILASRDARGELVLVTQGATKHFPLEGQIHPERPGNWPARTTSDRVHSAKRRWYAISANCQAECLAAVRPRDLSVTGMQQLTVCDVVRTYPAFASTYAICLIETP